MINVSHGLAEGVKLSLTHLEIDGGLVQLWAGSLAAPWLACSNPPQSSSSCSGPGEPEGTAAWMSSFSNEAGMLVNTVTLNTVTLDPSPEVLFSCLEGDRRG